MRLAQSAASWLLVIVTAAPLAMSAPKTAFAGDVATTQASEAYAEGVKLHKQRDYLHAAQAFARADELVPSSVALRAAIDQVLLADDPVLGMTLVERAARSSADQALRERAATASTKFAKRVGRVNVSCAGVERCLVTIDGSAAKVGAQWVLVGRHTILGQVGDEEAQQRLVDVAPAAQVDVAFKPKPMAAVAVVPMASDHAPPPESAPAPQIGATSSPGEPDTKRGGLAPAVFFVGAGITVVAGVATTLSALDTRSMREDFVTRGCDRADAPGCRTLSAQGANARTRTNILVAATGVLGVGTAVLGLFFVRWSSDTRSKASASRTTLRFSPTIGGGSLEGTF